MDRKLEISEISVIIQHFDHHGCLSVLATVGYPVGKEQDRRIILCKVSFSYIDKINRFDNGIINISTTPMHNAINK